MKQRRLLVLDNQRLRPALHSLSLNAAELEPGAWAPGQFLHVLCREPEAHSPFLRRAMPIHRLDAGRLDLLVRPDELGHAWLARRRAGDALDVLGPLGRGFDLPGTPGHLLLVARGLGIAPLVGLADQAVAHGWAVTLLATATRPADAYPAAQLSPAIEYQVCPTDAALWDCTPAALAWADMVAAAVPPAEWLPLRQRIEAARLTLVSGFAQVWADVPLACGVGRCGACAIETTRGWRHACSDGPVFDLTEVTGL
ncbi:MAG: hypothetical protein KKA73_04550 [Chloroflexi bacterium]|nr:hypothetical protein [Chloroflexota bacterium]MBU1746937.1 hypothetical protein [Chloroflexota bacterium]